MCHDTGIVMIAQRRHEHQVAPLFGIISMVHNMSRARTHVQMFRLHRDGSVVAGSEDRTSVECECGVRVVCGRGVPADVIVWNQCANSNYAMIYRCHQWFSPTAGVTSVFFLSGSRRGSVDYCS